MKRTFSKLFAAGLIGAVAGFSSGPLSSTAQAEAEAVNPCADPSPAQETGGFCRIGDATGFIQVTSDDNKTWTTVPGSTVVFLVHVFARAPKDEVLNTVRVLQGTTLLHHPNVHGHHLYQYDGAVHFNPIELSDANKIKIVATCNSKLNPAAANQQEEWVTTDITLMRTVQTEEHNGMRHDQPALTDVWTVDVKCWPFKRQFTVGGNTTDDANTSPKARPNSDQTSDSDPTRVPGAAVVGQTVKPLVDPVKPNPRRPVHPGLATTGKIDQTGAERRRKREEAAAAERKRKREAANERRRKAADAAERKRQQASERRRGAAEKAAKRRKAAADAAKLRKLMAKRRRAIGAKKKRAGPAGPRARLRNTRTRLR